LPELRGSAESKRSCDDVELWSMWFTVVRLVVEEKDWIAEKMEKGVWM
jgi:hypothetical protein